ncbi:MAG: hypothetical protein WCY09_06125 [Candidatus Omnitrophota bacterium]
MQKKDLIELGVTVILVAVMIFVFSSAIKKSHTRNAKPKVVELTGLPVSPESAVNSKDLYNLLLEQANLMELKRDPFTAAPIVIKKNMQSGVALTGILWDKNKPLAIIDGEVVKIGQRVGDKTLIEIKRDRVILSDGETLSEVVLER